MGSLRNTIVPIPCFNDRLRTLAENYYYGIVDADELFRVINTLLAKYSQLNSKINQNVILKRVEELLDYREDNYMDIVPVNRTFPTTHKPTN